MCESPPPPAPPPSCPSGGERERRSQGETGSNHANLWIQETNETSQPSFLLPLHHRGNQWILPPTSTPHWFQFVHFPLI